MTHNQFMNIALGLPPDHGRRGLSGPPGTPPPRHVALWLLLGGLAAAAVALVAML